MIATAGPAPWLALEAVRLLRHLAVLLDDYRDAPRVPQPRDRRRG